MTREEKLDPRALASFICMVFGMFMALLDIQIVAASLSEIQAGVNASAEEITWVQTSYMVAEVIMIPMSGYISRALSTRGMFVVSAAGFSAMSLMCATSDSIGELILWRALQGFLGGGMIPTVFAASYTIFPPRKRFLIAPIVGLVATMAPTAGPTIGGYLTDLYSWRWLFLVNIVPGVLIAAFSFILIDFDRPQFGLLRRFDWVGFTLMAGFLGSLEYVLEDGANNDWFAYRPIVIMTVVCAVSGIGFFWRFLSVDDPIVDLRAFANRNFTTGCIFSFVLGFGLYGLIYLYPYYLGRVRGYSSLMIGETVFVSGAAMLLGTPLSSILMRRLDPRAMLALGLSGFSASCFMLTDITKDWDYWELFLPQIVRGGSLMLCMVPINNIALGTLPAETVKSASGLFNLTRNLGGAMGLAIIHTTLNARWDFHLQRLHESVAWTRDAAILRLSLLTQSLTPRLGPLAEPAALKTLASSVRQQALVMSFADVFLLLSLTFGILVFPLLVVRRARISGAAGD